LVKPSIAQALKVTKPIFWSSGGMMNRGTMLPPSADMTSTTRVVREES